MPGANISDGSLRQFTQHGCSVVIFVSNKEKSNTGKTFTYNGAIYVIDKANTSAIVEEYASISERKSDKAVRELHETVKSWQFPPPRQQIE